MQINGLVKLLLEGLLGFCGLYHDALEGATVKVFAQQAQASVTTRLV